MSKGTLVRTALLVLALVNQLLAAFGISPLPLENETVSELLTLGFTAVTALVAWWKNNSFTKEAQAADEYLHALREA